MQERRAKGLCFNYNEKLVPRHRCMKLFLIEASSRDLSACNLRDMSSQNHGCESSLGHIIVMVLIDLGSTHNFMSEMLAKKVGLQPTSSSCFEVMVASREKHPSPGEYSDINCLECPMVRILGPIMWDFARLLMTFKVVEKEVTLKGITSSFVKQGKIRRGCCSTYIRLGLHFLRLMAKINLPNCNIFWKNSRTCWRNPKDYHLHNHMIIGFH
ncbi:hypothetical protein AMTRI_Chr11g156140 [Amborella trichopoda]